MSETYIRSLELGKSSDIVEEYSGYSSINRYACDQCSAIFKKKSHN